MLAYEELDIEKYRFIATLDKRTSVKCQEMDNKEFEVHKRKMGINYPPLHPNCRSTTVAVFEDEDIENLQRKARDKENNPILVPQDMNYRRVESKIYRYDRRGKRSNS